MSIPPLVCSTPPPPEQCEDDKEEDFDIQYRLSQEDEDENDTYNYGNFSTYSDYHQEFTVDESIKDIKSESPKDSINAVDNDKLQDSSDLADNIDKHEVSPKFEDVAVEDLNLKIEQEPISESLTTDTLHITDESDSYGISCIVDHLDSPDKTVLASTSNDEDSSDEKSQSDANVISLDNNMQEDSPVNKLDLQEIDQIEKEEITHVDMQSNVECESEKIKDEEIDAQTTTDDFDDFENFQFTSNTECQDEVIPNFEDPWHNNDTEDFNFGDFKANFDTNTCDTQPSSEDQPINKQIETDTNEENIENGNLDDDFGDFDDFKSSAIQKAEEKKSVESEIAHQVPVLNFQCPDNETQIIESINNILFNIFTEDIEQDNTESEIKLERNLESMLTEIWHHLKQVDERQPYIIQWNNSLGQKSLLKALCIDSRNILFGPKWNYFTPKYATNLSVAPLQPQKPTTVATTTPSENVNVSDKVVTKESTTWSDPFTSEGQEYTYAEALLLDLENLMATLDQMAQKHSTLKISELLSNASNVDREQSTKEIRQPDLDVFENAISVTSINNIHSSTLSVQPLRQINLPDTHIFTPMDSETPRSKTIHYDNGPPVLLPKQVMDNHTISHEKTAPPHSEVNNDDYWEFQDFKGVSDNLEQVSGGGNLKTEDKDVISPNVNPPVNSKITYQTQLLQPVKLEPIMPKLNWPDPGEVKETFDDFSDFISKTNWNHESEEKPSHNAMPTTTSIDDKENGSRIESTTVDDDFETFQSAPPSVPQVNHVPNDNSFNHLEAVSGMQNQMDSLSLKSNSVLPLQQSISTSTIPNSIQSKTTSSNFTLNPSPLSHNTVLQPMNSSVTVRAPQSGQILQPLSLESYSQINWPKPGIDLQNLASFNPLESLQSLKSDTGSGGPSKVSSPIHGKVNAVQNDTDDDIWGDFVSSKPKQHAPKKTPIFADDDEWTDFVSSPSISQNSLNTISFNVQTNSNKSPKFNNASKSNQNNIALEIPSLNYITPKSSNRGAYIDKHFQNL